MKTSPVRIYAAIALFLVGLMAVMQLRTHSQVLKAAEARSSVDQAFILSNLIDSNANLRREITRLEEQIAKYEVSSGKAELEALVADVNRLKIVNGLVEVSGEGVEVWVQGEIGVTNIQDLINELRNAGAEAISINNLRIVARSIIASGEQGIIADNIQLQPLYVLRALGSSQTLERALERKGGLVSLLRYNYPTIAIRVYKQENIVLPIYQGSYQFISTQAVK